MKADRPPQRRRIEEAVEIPATAKPVLARVVFMVCWNTMALCKIEWITEFLGEIGRAHV